MGKAITQVLDDFLLALWGNVSDLDQLLAKYLASVTRLIPSSSVGIYLLDPESGQPTRMADTGSPTRFLRVYETAGRSLDPLLAYIRRHREPVHDGMLFTQSDWCHHGFASVRRVAKIGPIIEAPLVDSARIIGTLNFARQEGQRGYDEHDLALAKRISEHVTRAVTHARELARAREQERLTSATLEALNAAVMVRNRQGHVLYANAAGLDLLRQCHIDEGLRTALDDALATNRSTSHTNLGRRVNIVHPASHTLGRDSYVSVRSVSLPSSDAIATFVFRPGEDPSFQHLRSLMSEREIAVLELIAGGLEYKEVADHLGLSIETVKTHVKRMFAKMQVSSRSQLISQALFPGWNCDDYRPWPHRHES